MYCASMVLSVLVFLFRRQVIQKNWYYSDFILGILRACQTAGMSMIMWVSVGVLALLGALCYVELGLTIPKTGGEYAIFDYVYGPRFAFMFAWVSLFDF